MESRSTVSKERVKKNGEVFTPDEIVNDMLDMLETEMNDWDYIKRTRLEPTCGDGAILVRILDRKLGRVQNIKDQGGDWKEALLYAVSSIYGVDITPDNVVMSKRRMMDVIKNGRTPVLVLKEERSWRSNGFELDNELIELLHNILDYNIQCGDTLKNEQYLIYEPEQDLWNCNLEYINEHNVFKCKLDKNGKELEGWGLQHNDLLLTQWCFEGTKYKNRQISFEQLKYGGKPKYRDTEALEIYYKEELSYDF